MSIITIARYNSDNNIKTTLTTTKKKVKTTTLKLIATTTDLWQLHWKAFISISQKVINSDSLS